MGLIIKKEIEKSPNYQIIKEAIESHGEIFMYSDYGEILRPFLSLEEIKNGEHEVIAISYILDFRKADFIVIIDDDSPRKFLERNFPFIFQRVTGTIGLIEICSCNYKVFSKGEALIILSLINRSKFRVKEEIVNKTIEKIKEC
jgi:predicted nucleic acid-binding protein